MRIVALILAASLTLSVTSAEGTPALRGDPSGDGRISALDALLTLAHVVGGAIPVSGNVLPVLDADCNDAVEAVDALHFLRSAVGIQPLVSLAARCSIPSSPELS